MAAMMGRTSRTLLAALCKGHLCSSAPSSALSAPLVSPVVRSAKARPVLVPYRVSLARSSPHVWRVQS